MRKYHILLFLFLASILTFCKDKNVDIDTKTIRVVTANVVPTPMMAEAVIFNNGSSDLDTVYQVTIKVSTLTRFNCNSIGIQIRMSGIPDVFPVYNRTVKSISPGVYVVDVPLPTNDIYSFDLTGFIELENGELIKDYNTQFFAFPLPKIVADLDGNLYTSVKIGPQEWLTSNLRTTHFSSGNPISLNSDNNSWKTTKFAAYSNYNNDSSNTILNGRLYNFTTVTDLNNVCPVGWTVPDQNDINVLKFTLTNAIGVDNAALALKNSIDWKQNPGKDFYGFNAIPSGRRLPDGTFMNEGQLGHWWTKSTDFNSKPIEFSISDENQRIILKSVEPNNGSAIRCILDLSI